MDETVAVLAFLALLGPSCTGSDNFALLGGTLKTMQQAACDDEIVSLACPRGTSISIQVAAYGKTAPQGHNCMTESTNFRDIAVEVEGAEKCLWPNSMQYSLLQTVVEACQKKPQCKFSTKPKPGLVDPCPLARKYVEVAYKCRPYEFRSRTACENDVLKLSCNPFSRVAVFDAQYGRTAYDVICPQRQGVSDESCTAPHAAETVMQICHGKRWCSITANNKTFGSPCKLVSRTYLKVIYACVPLGVLTEKYESASERDEIANSDGKQNDIEGGLFDDSEGASEKWEPNAVSPVADPALQPLPEENISPPKVEQPTIQKPVQERDPSSDQDQSTKASMFIYIGVGLLVFIILTILLIGVRCYIIRKSSRTSKTGDMFTTEAPNIFNDAVSDIDNDIDVGHLSGTFHDPMHPDMLLYRDLPGNRGTLRAMRPLSTIYPCAGASMYGVDYVPPSRDVPVRFKDDDVAPEILSPKSLDRYSSSNYYYG